MLDLHHSGVVVVVGKIHLHRRLKKLLLDGLRLKPHRAVRQPPFRKIVILVDHPGVDQVPVFHLGFGLPIVCLQPHLNPRMIQNSFKHRRVAVSRQRLKLLRHKTVVPVRPHRNSAADRSIQLRRFPPPLLPRVVPEKHLIKFPAHLGNHHFLRVFGVIHRHPPLRQRRLHLLRGRGPPQILLKRVQVDRKLPILAVGPDQHLVVYRVPVGEPTQIRDHLVGIGAKVVRPIGMDQNARRIGPVMRVAGNVVSPVHHQAPLARPLRQPFR